MDLTTLHLLVSVFALTALGIAAVLTVIRMAKGPSILDRVVAADVLIAVVIAGLVVEEVINQHSSTNAKIRENHCSER